MTDTYRPATDGLPACRFSTALVDYDDATRFMRQQADDIYHHRAEELLWFLEHPSLYTAGASAKETDLLQPDRLPLYHSKRGGQYTYHGPGQRVVYVMLDLRERGRDVRAFVSGLERWIILTLARFGITAHTREGCVGVWVGDDKIASLGIRLSRWVSYHGIAVNVCPDLSHFAGIIPCGISEQDTTSMAQLGYNTTMQELDDALLTCFTQAF